MKIKLDKKAKSAIAVYFIILFIYVLTFLVTPFNKRAASWISFAFTIISLVCSLIVCGIAYKSRGTLVSKIYGFPIFKIGVMYAIVQLVIGIIICVIGAFAEIPYWCALLFSVILLGAAVIGVIVTDNTRDMIEDADESIRFETYNATYFQINIAGIVDECKSPDVKVDLEALNQLFEFSDPVTSNETQYIEEIIKTMLTELKVLIVDGSNDDIKALIKKITNAVKERNRICKAAKQ